ncbi:MAG: dihydrodipicolinate synthase family protein [Thermoguttaceae bacterium]
MSQSIDPAIHKLLQRGLAIPACPLALDGHRRFTPRRQRALLRYYAASGAGGAAVGVHTTQFAIHDPKVGLLEPVLSLAAEEFDRGDACRREPLVRIAGICGRTEQAVAEAGLARDLRYHAGLLSLGALRDASDNAILTHCRAVANVLPLIGFYLQPAVGGRSLSYAFWRRFAEIEAVAAIKIAPFDRYRTLDVVRAVTDSGRDDIALYTGNDDHIVLDLLATYRFQVAGQPVERRMVGGLLGHWAVWTSKAVELLDQCHAAANQGPIPRELLRRAQEVTDANAALFDVAHGFAGCIAGIHEVLRRQGLLEGIWCLDPNETLSKGQMAELDRVCAAYPHLTDDAFVAEHLDQWLAD